MKKHEARLCIYPKDIQRITGKSYRQSIRILKAVRQMFDKPENSYVSVTEFCMYSGLTYQEVTAFLDWL